MVYIYWTLAYFYTSMSHCERIPIEDLKIGMFVEHVESKRTAQGNGSTKVCPIKQAGYIRSEAILMALKQYDVEYVLVRNSNEVSDQPETQRPSSDLPKTRADDIARKLKESNLATRIVKVLDLAKHAENQLKHLTARIESIGEKDFEVLEHIANDMNKVLADDPVATMLLIKLHDTQPSVYDHSINVAMLTGLFSLNMGFEAAICHELIMAGLLHDIGLTTVPKRILNNRRYLSEAETRILQGHVDLGKEVLQTQYKNISDICLSAILHHHERLNGNGYPEGLTADLISFWGKILAITDSYESMTSCRYNRTRKTNNEAMSEMIKVSGHDYDASLLALFAQFIGAYPVGSCVLCSRQDEPFLGIVTHDNPQDPLKPEVAIFFDVEKNRGIPMVSEDLADPACEYTLTKAVNSESYTPDMDLMSFLTRMRN